jgi:TonB family protein
VRPLEAGGRRDDRSPPAPLVEHSILDALAGLEERPTRTFPIERAILISLFAHVVLVLILAFMPAKSARNAKGDLLAGFYPPDKEKDDTPIPVIFAPGPQRANPKPSAPLSDADRRAGGGDPSLPKAEKPFVPPSNGVAGLAPGPRAPRVPASRAPARPQTPAEARGGAEQQPPQTAEKKQPSEFPTQQSPLTSGPREQTRLAGLDQAIRDAVRGTVAGGQGGAPEPNPDGGFVDSGPLSFDTKWYDWGPYAAEMVRRIKLHWDVPELARLGWKGSLTVRFFIMADGTVADAQIVRASGIPPFDHAAFQAILKSSKFRPLPADLLAQVPGKDREGITVTFFYNMRLDEEEDGAPGPPGPPKKSP